MPEQRVQWRAVGEEIFKNWCLAKFWLRNVLRNWSQGWDIVIWTTPQWPDQSRLCQCWQRQFLVRRTWHRWRPEACCWAETSTERAVDRGNTQSLCSIRWHCMIFYMYVFVTWWSLIAYSLNDTLHLGDPVNTVNNCRVFQKSLLDSLSSHSNLGKISMLKQ